MAKQQRRAKSKGEKGWARREKERVQKKFAEQWWSELEEKAKDSEVGKATGSWDKTPARHRFEQARRLQREKEGLQGRTIEKIANELQQLEQLDKQLERFGQRAGAEDSSEEEGRQVVAAVREADDFEDGEDGGSGVGHEQGTTWARVGHE